MRPLVRSVGIAALFGALAAAFPAAQGKTAPTIDQVLALERAGSPEISPDGRLVAYTVRVTNWDDNTYDTRIWLAEVATGTTRQLTGGKKSSQSPAWSPDGTRLAFVSDRTDKRQIYLIDPTGGEAQPLTASEEGVGSFVWSPDGRSIAFTATEGKPASIKEREKSLGEFDIVDQEPRMTHLWVVNVATKTARQLTAGRFVVGNFDWSPDSASIAYDHRVSSDPAMGGTADIAVVSVADGKVRELVTQDGPDTRPLWSPDGTRIAFESAMKNPSYFYTNTVLATIASNGGAIEPLTAAFDENPSPLAWKKDGLYFSAAARTYSHLYRIDPSSKAIARLTPADDAVASAFSLSADASRVAFLGADARSMAEVFTAATSDLVSAPGSGHKAASLKKLTSLNAQTASWSTGTVEVVSWKSQDGASIEGILHKPDGFDPARKYPLLVVIHGGPTGVSRAVPYTSATYPIDVWVPRGILVLEPNYRGSAGYGEKFRALNVRNLGVGDAWDVLSGVDALIAKGFVDPARVGTMGWSQGGYISAFLATHDASRFKAISVGAGISDWTTYYVNTDIHPFTRQYLQATPWDDPAIYAKTSPITYIKQARTPVLIQHGATDQRVPLPNAYELYQGLQDVGVPVKLIVYQGFGGIGHGPSKPKSHRATMTHNLEWFDEQMFGGAAKTATEAPKAK